MNEEMKTNEIVDEVMDTEETIQDVDTSDENYEIEEFEDEKKSSGFGAVAVAGIIGTALVAGGIALYKKYTGKAKKRKLFGKNNSNDEVVDAEVVAEKKTQDEYDNDVYVEETSEEKSDIFNNFK